MADVDQQPASSTLSIGEAEFQRLQTQLIDLRTTNYQLKEQQQKHNTEISQLQETVQSQSRELERASKTIQRSKKAKEFQTLVEENDSLQRKMQTQEEDFRLQNKTLMEELSKVCDENESLQSQLRGGGGKRGGAGGEELMHLRAQNTALQKSLQALQDQLQGESASEQPTDASQNARVLELEVQLGTEEEEKRMLRQKLEEVQDSARREQAELQSELEKWTDKAKKKQDSLTQVQEEKEKYFHESRATFDEMVRSKDHEIQLLQNRVESLKKDVDAHSQSSATSQEIAKQLETLSTAKEEMSLKCAIMTEEKDSLVRDRDEMKSLLDELGRELHQTKADLGEERKTSTDLQTELEEAKLSQEQLADQVVKTSEEKHHLSQELEAAQKLAEKRKCLLDELSIKGQESASQHRRQSEQQQGQFRVDISRLEERLKEEQLHSRHLAEANEELPELRRKLVALQEVDTTHKTRIAELEEEQSREREASQESLESLRAEQEEQTRSLRAELESCSLEAEQNRDRVKELAQAVQDKEEEMKIVEKKSNSMLKDLKRQLQHMQKREERLQEQVSELKGAQTMEHIFTSSPVPPNRELSHDSVSHSRESSLSSLRGLGTDGPPSVTLSSPTTASTPSGGLQFTAQQQGLSEETRELVARIADLQQEKWVLEERVNHLESTGSALAEDVIQKSEIIKSYYMENKADHQPSKRDKISPMRLMHWSKSREDSTAGEINRRMQRALEEALMKNIHLQENIDMLSSELEKYTKADGSSKGEESPSDQPVEPAEDPVPDSGAN